MTRIGMLFLFSAAIIDLAACDLTATVVSYATGKCGPSCSATQNVPAAPLCPDGYTVSKTQTACFNCTYSVSKIATFPYLEFVSNCPCTDWTSCAVTNNVDKSNRCSVSQPAMTFIARECTVDINGIATRFAPKMWLAKTEPYFPSSVEFHFSHTRLEGVSYLPSNTKMPATGRLVTRESVSGSDILPFFHGQSNLIAVPVYALVADRVGYLDIAYFQFYPYNRGKSFCIGYKADNKCIGVEISGHCIGHRVDGCIGGYSMFGNHVADWEGNIVRLKNGQPHAVYLSAHGHDGTSTGWYQYNSMLKAYISEAKGKMIKTDGTHPIVYSAWGSHGVYADAGRQLYKTVANGESLADITNQGTAWNSWNNVKAIKYNPNGGYTGTWAWLNFDGRWGNDKGSKCLGAIVAKVIGGDHCVLESGPSSINFNGHMISGNY